MQLEGCYWRCKGQKHGHESLKHGATQMDCDGRWRGEVSIVLDEGCQKQGAAVVIIARRYNRL